MTDSENTQSTQPENSQSAAPTDQVSQNPPAEQAPPTLNAPAPTPSPTGSSAPASQPVSTSQGMLQPSASASSVLGKILQTTASVIVGILPTIPTGAIGAGAALAEEGLRAVAEFLTSKGSDNALTEAEAEKQLAALVASLATIANPLPTPAQLEAQGPQTT